MRFISQIGLNRPTKLITTRLKTQSRSTPSTFNNTATFQKSTSSHSTPSSESLTFQRLKELCRLSSIESPEEGSDDFNSLKSSLDSILKLIDQQLEEFDYLLLEDQTDKSKITNETVDRINYSNADNYQSRTVQMQVDWNRLLETQMKFYNSRRLNIPGTEETKPSTQSNIRTNLTGSTDDDSETDDENVLENSIVGLHVFYKDRIGSSPDESQPVYLVLKKLKDC